MEVRHATEHNTSSLYGQLISQQYSSDHGCTPREPHHDNENTLCSRPVWRAAALLGHQSLSMSGMLHGLTYRRQLTLRPRAATSSATGNLSRPSLSQTSYRSAAPRNMCTLANRLYLYIHTSQALIDYDIKHHLKLPALPSLLFLHCLSCQTCFVHHRFCPETLKLAGQVICKFKHMQV